MRTLSSHELAIIHGGNSEIDDKIDQYERDSVGYVIGRFTVSLTSSVVGLIPLFGPIVKNWLTADYDPNSRNSPSNGEYFVGSIINSIVTLIFP